MNVNQKIEGALSELAAGNIWPLSCPLEEPPEIYMVYVPELERPEDFGDNKDLEWVHYMQVHWFAQGRKNYLKPRKMIRRLLKDAGFSVTEIVCMYEKDIIGTKDTNATHLVFHCNIPEEDPYGEV